jgi:hypothetical protein
MKFGQIGKRLGCGSVLVFAYLSACTKWQVQQVSPQQLLTQGQPEKLRLSLVDNTEVVLRRPEIRGDSLYGVRDESALRLDYASGRPPSHGASAALPLADVEKVAVRKINPVTTGLLVGLGVAAVYFVIGLAQLGDQ